MIVKKCIISLLVWSILLLPHPVHAETEQDKQQVAAFLSELYKFRTDLLLNQNAETVKKYYLQDEKTSNYAFRQELKRTKYLNAWAAKRKVTLSEANDRIRIVNIRLRGDQAKVSLIHTLKVTYSYPNQNLRPQSFGLGTRHALTLKKTNNSWHVLREWYLDPFDVDVDLLADAAPAVQASERQPNHVLQPASSSPKKYNRQRAVEYAHKYAGAAWGAGNKNRYNPRYRDYTYIGGDCTNFASQVIGDAKEGGGLPMRFGWHYIYNVGGSAQWVRTDSFKNFLFSSGYGRLIARGSFEQVVKPSSKYPNGAIAKLQPGDLIAYEIGGGNVDHFATVVGFDDNGYPLVDCHTADRFCMPFDLGWDKNTRFLLIHIKD